jgi:hypothetical protein
MTLTSDSRWREQLIQRATACGAGRDVQGRRERLDATRREEWKMQMQMVRWGYFHVPKHAQEVQMEEHMGSNRMVLQ